MKRYLARNLALCCAVLGMLTLVGCASSNGSGMSSGSPDGSGFPQTSKTGVVSELPIQYICGASEVADLCNDRARDDTAKYVVKYTYHRMDQCGHDLTKPQACPQYQEVIDNVLHHIEAAP